MILLKNSEAKLTRHSLEPPPPPPKFVFIHSSETNEWKQTFVKFYKLFIYSFIYFIDFEEWDFLDFFSSFFLLNVLCWR